MVESFSVGESLEESFSVVSVGESLEESFSVGGSLEV